MKIFKKLLTIVNEFKKYLPLDTKSLCDFTRGERFQKKYYKKIVPSVALGYEGGVCADSVYACYHSTLVRPECFALAKCIEGCKKLWRRGKQNSLPGEALCEAWVSKHEFFKKLLIASVLLLTNIIFTDATESDLQVSVQAQKTKKIHIGLVSLGHTDAEFKQTLERLKKDLEWSGQCIVEEKHLATFTHERNLKDLFEAQVAVAVIISKDHRLYNWHLYDVSTVKMLGGKKVEQGNDTAGYVAHTIADQLWPQLFGTQSSFRSKIAYSKQIWRKKYGKDKPYKQIWIADFDGSNPRLFIDTPTVSFAPRWNNDVSCPLLFYSENTISNVQLVMSNMFGKRKIICSFDGLNMQPTFSDDGKKIVFCLSKDGTSQLYLSYINHLSGQRHFDRLTFNTADNIAPCFVDNTHIAFVSDYKTGKPQIYLLDLKIKTIEPITDGGYCACPAYSPVRKQLVYSKMMGAGMQLFLYDLKTATHTQITNGPGSKEEASWSACGNYIVFGSNKGLDSRIAQLHLPTKAIKYLTSEKDNCTYPTCSPIYEENLGILHK